MDLEQRAWRVEGRVQGVGFRWWTQKAGTELGLRGTVTNCPDGSVEVHAAGPSDRLDELATRLGRGPSYASVRAVREVGSGHDLPATGFQILR